MRLSTNNNKHAVKSKIKNTFHSSKNNIMIEINNEPDMNTSRLGSDLINFKNHFESDLILNNFPKNDMTNFSLDKTSTNDVHLDYNIGSLENLVCGNEETVEKTLPGLIISIILKNSCEATEEFLINYISPIIGNLRKPDGSKYKGNTLRVIKSTLCSSGIFEKKEINLSKNSNINLDNYIKDENKKSIFTSSIWIIKIKEAVQYLSRTIEKFQIKIMEKEKKMEEKQLNLLGKKTKRIRCSLKKHNIKVHKIYNVLDDLLKNYRKNPEMKNILKCPFNNINTATDLFKKCPDENTCMGILLCFKFFRPFINKVLRLNSEEKKTKNEDQLKKINLKMEEMENKLIDIQKNLIDTCKMETNN